MDQLLLSYFDDLFVSRGCDDSCVLDSVLSKLDYQSRDLMSANFSPEDVRAAIFSMNPDKSPGLDGLNPAFFPKILECGRR